jgi:hypothetical protein
MALYWDGQPWRRIRGGNRPNHKSHFFIGDSPDSTGRSFNGGINEVALWDRVLSPTEVATIYKAFTTNP